MIPCIFTPFKKFKGQPCLAGRI